MSPLNLTKRDNLSSAIRPFVITFSVCLGAAACLLMGYAIHRVMGMKAAPNAYKPRSAEQDDYMREVRQRNRNNLMAELSDQRRR